jgi:hypothetical protein
MLLYADVRYLRIPDRRFMSRTIAPALSNTHPMRILNIGVHYYTVRLQRYFLNKNIDLYTTDIDAAKSMWGVPGKHCICGAADLHLHFSKGFFDAVILNGVLGYGINSLSDINEALATLAHILNNRGLLIIGWDVNMSPDPLDGTICLDLFTPYPGLIGISRSGAPNGLFDAQGGQAFKVYDVLERRP